MEIRAVDGRMAVRTHGLVGETSVEAGYHDVAAVAKLRDLLKFELVAIGSTVRLVAGDAAIDHYRAMLEDEGAGLVDMALRALLLLETTEHSALCWRMGIVAIVATEDAFLEAMALVELERGHGRGVAASAGCRRSVEIEEGSRWLELEKVGAGSRVDRVAARTIEPDLRMRRGMEARLIGCVTGQALSTALVGGRIVVERKQSVGVARFQMASGVAMATAAARCHAMVLCDPEIAIEG